LEGNFPVTYQGQTVGTVTVSREGLYCRISCRCRMPEGKIHRLYAGAERLGVLMPEGGTLVLQTRVAAKRLKPNCPFSLEKNGEMFIPIRPGEAFAHLGRLRQARFACREGEPGLYLE